MLMSFRIMSPSFKTGFRYACFTTSAGENSTVIHLPAKSLIYSFGASNKTSSPLLSMNDVEWTVNAGEAWGIVGRGKNVIFQTLLGHTRISPIPPQGLFPVMYDIDPYSQIEYVSFRNSGAHSGNAGDFYDYTAKYGAMRDGDYRTLAQSLFEIEGNVLTPDEQAALMHSLGLTELLSIPLIALSNGQTRRARIARALFKNPKLMLLDEPLTGLDPASRGRLTRLLNDFKSARHPTCITGLRLQEIVDLKHNSTQDVSADYITHILHIEHDKIWAGTKEQFVNERAMNQKEDRRAYSFSYRDEEKPRSTTPEEAKLIVDLKGVNVKYGERKVLNDINWQIRQGERWHLQGANGSGKTTLLSLLTGDHPQSYTQPHLLLPALETATSASHYHTWHIKPRKRTPTPHLRALIGIVLPELFDAFPRRHPGMTVWDAVQTGFSGGFVPAGKGVGHIHVDDWGMNGNILPETQKWRMVRCWEVLEGLGPAAWDDDSSPKFPINLSQNTFVSSLTHTFASKHFPSLTPGEQRLVLLMRALVGRPPLVILDEVWSGMDDRMIRAVRRYLSRNEPASKKHGTLNPGSPGLGTDQAVIVVTHWEEEVPWCEDDGLRRFRLEEGRGRILLS